MGIAASRQSVGQGLLWVSPWLVGFVLFLALPVGLSLYYSATDYTLLGEPVYVGAANYRELLSDSLFHTSLRNTLVFAAGSAVGVTVLAVLIAWLVEMPLRGAGAVRAIVFAPTIVPVVSACVTWLWMYNAEFGLINNALGTVGIKGPDWLGDKSWALPSLVFMGFWIIGSPVIVCAAALKEVPASLHEAADLDGAGSLSRLRHVTLPMISPALLFNALMAAIWSVQVFAPPKIMTNGGPENSTLVYSMYVYSNAFVYGRMGYACALAWVQVAITLVLTLGVLGLGRRFVYYRTA